MSYKKRIADKILIDKLEAKGAVLIEGAKWCGKTTTAKQIAKSVLNMQNPKDKKENLLMAEINPSILLSGDTPRLIDEWQLAPSLWDAIRFEVDERNKFNQFILTGSSVPVLDGSTTHTGTGRIARLLMRPMSLFESGDSNGKVSLSELFNGKKIISEVNNLNNIEDLAYLVCRGGWPKAIDQNKRVALVQAYDYYDAVVSADISNVDGVSRNQERVKLLMKSYSRMIASEGRIANIRKDMISNDTDSLSEDTILSYINALKRIFVIEDLPAWNPNLRSKSAIRTSDIRHFVDPSIAVAALGISPNDLINDLETFGLFFESMCIRDLRIYTESLDGSVYHYRDSSGLECDAVVHLRNGRYGLIEVKLGGESHIDEGANNLMKFRDKIDTKKMKSPEFLMVLTGTSKYAYQREDGIYVVPICCLRD